tara:strand:- start:340 stop:534 length:195 start_codon:yes stop_codon:yes gene_type:complete
MKNTLTSFYLRKYKEAVPKGDSNIHEAIDLLLRYLDDTLDEPVEEFPDSGFTDSFDAKATMALK